MGQLLTVALLAATALFGGLDTVSTTVTPFKTGEQFSDGPFTVTIDRASFPREIRGTIHPAVGVAVKLRLAEQPPRKDRQGSDRQPLVSRHQV